MKLIGSKASPFVRRTRIAAEDMPIEFEQINVFSDEGQARLKDLGEIRRVPILIDAEHIVWDSMLIHKYLTHEKFEVDYEKDLILINEANDAALLLLQFKTFKMDENWQNGFSQNILTRVNDILGYFEGLAQEEEVHWNTKGIWLFCLLDWLSFREIIPWEENCPSLAQFRDKQLKLDIIQATDPRV